MSLRELAERAHQNRVRMLADLNGWIPREGRSAPAVVQVAVQAMIYRLEALESDYAAKHTDAQSNAREDGDA